LGVAVTDPFRRHPALLAQTAQTLHDLSSGRFVLGIGLGAGNNLVPIGLPGSARVAVLEEAIDIMRLLWSSTEPVSFDGATWQLDRAILGLDSAHYGQPAVWIGGAGPRSLSLTGRKADGWLPVMMPPDAYASRLAAIRRHAAEQSRDPDTITAGCLFLTIAAASARECRHLLGSPWTKALALFQPAVFFEQYGCRHPLGDGAAGVRDYIASHASVADYLDLVADIPLELVERLVLWGDVERLATELRRYANVGVQHAVIFNVTGMGVPPPGVVRSSYEVLAAVQDTLGHG
jgi:phthiodiolone/phenolphthiodiolone dimycocerosates ketoreductase